MTERRCKTCAHSERSTFEFPCNQCVTKTTYTYLKFYRTKKEVSKIEEEEE